jgi:hypothetical protein
MFDKLLSLANKLDSAGLHKEADYLDKIIVAASEKYTKKQLETFDQGDRDGKPFEKVDFKALKNNTEDATGLIKCPNCGTMNANTNQVCKHCGTSLV